jgi:hypothetical protein
MPPTKLESLRISCAELASCRTAAPIGPLPMRPLKAAGTEDGCDSDDVVIVASIAPMIDFTVAASTSSAPMGPPIGCGCRPWRSLGKGCPGGAADGGPGRLAALPAAPGTGIIIGGGCMLAAPCRQGAADSGGGHGAPPVPTKLLPLLVNKPACTTPAAGGGCLKFAAGGGGCFVGSGFKPSSVGCVCPGPSGGGGGRA